MKKPEIFKAAVIGLGNIGFRFNLDPLRKETWSHVSAYEKCRHTELIGVVDDDEESVLLFKKQFNNIPAFLSIGELMGDQDIDIVSICTPTATHYPVLKEILKYPVKAVFCEKPIASTIQDAINMVEMCAAKNVFLSVNHTRRWDGHYLLIKAMIDDGKIGKIKAVHGFYSGQIYNIGTHLIDAIRMLVKMVPGKVSGISPDIKKEDPDVSGWMQLEQGVLCTITATGKREDLLFEIDIIGEEGRIRSLQNGGQIEWDVFTESHRYSGYRELKAQPVEGERRRDRLVESVNDLCAVIRDDEHKLSCTGKDGLVALATSTAFVESAKKGGEPKLVDCEFYVS